MCLPPSRVLCAVPGRSRIGRGVSFSSKELASCTWHSNLRCYSAFLLSVRFQGIEGKNKCIQSFRLICPFTFHCVFTERPLVIWRFSECLRLVLRTCRHPMRKNFAANHQNLPGKGPSNGWSHEVHVLRPGRCDRQRILRPSRLISSTFIKLQHVNMLSCPKMNFFCKILLFLRIWSCLTFVRSPGWGVKHWKPQKSMAAPIHKCWIFSLNTHRGQNNWWWIFRSLSVCICENKYWPTKGVSTPCASSFNFPVLSLENYYWHTDCSISS